MKKEEKHLKKSLFLNTLGLLFGAREKVLNSFKNRLFPVKNLDKILTQETAPEPRAETAAEPKRKVATEPTPKSAAEATPTKHKKSTLKLQQEFMN